MGADHVFHDYLTAACLSPASAQARKAVLEVWAANGHPQVIETTDPRHGDDARTFFVFFMDRLGPSFAVTQFPPLSSLLHCPPHLARPSEAPAVAEVDPYLAAYRPDPVAV